MTPEEWKRVNALFHRALEIDPNERAAFLDRECSGDAAIRAAVESLLASYDELEKELRSEQTETRPVSAQPLSVGQQVGQYRIEREIGRGGMGIVYLAEDTRLGRVVALKVLPPEFTHDAERRVRLEDEAKAAAQLRHPGLATVHELTEFGDLLCIVSEYVGDHTLRDDLDGGALPLGSVLDLGVQIADALAHAHAHRVIHRDLKPENVIRTDEGRIKIVDFGLALVERPADGTPGAQRRTRAGMALGTPAYMAPEQIRTGRVDFRTDLFAFGILLYELAAGIHPFEGPDVPSTLARILRFEPGPLGPPLVGVPTELDRIVRKCLRKNPDHRYQSTRDLVVDLDELRRGTPPKPLPVRSNARWWWRFHQTAVTAFYSVAAVSAWVVQDTAEDLLSTALLYGAVMCTVLPGAFRLHLLFLDRVRPAALAAQVRWAGARVRWCDWALTVLLLLMAGRLMTLSTVMAVALMALALGFGVAFLAVEPTTTRAAFGRHVLGIRRRRST